jgi:hypothetical protein
MTPDLRDASLLGDYGNDPECAAPTLGAMSSSALKRNTLRGVLTQTRELDTVWSKFKSTKI